MARVNDVGGQTGFGPLRIEPDEPPFHADWEARVYALNVAMLRRGAYDLDRFRDAIERMPPEDRPPVRMIANHVWAMSHGVVELFGRGRPGGRAPIGAGDMLESGVLIYLRGLGVIPADPAR